MNRHCILSYPNISCDYRVVFGILELYFFSVMPYCITSYPLNANNQSNATAGSNLPILMNVNKQTVKKKEIILSQTSPKKRINCKYKIKMFVKIVGILYIANVMKNVIMKFQSNPLVQPENSTNTTKNVSKL